MKDVVRVDIGEVSIENTDRHSAEHGLIVEDVFMR